MTLKTDLQSATDGGPRRLFLKIDGHKDVFWQEGEFVLGPDGKPVPGEGPPGAHPITEDCIGLWRFDEYAATEDAADATGNSHTAAQTDSPPVIAAGKLGGARRINGSSDQLLVTDAASLHPQSFTVAGWVYPRNATQTDSASIWFNDACQIMVNSTGLNLDCTLTFTSGTLTVNTGSALTNTTWNHIAVTWDQTTLSVYIDGVLKGSDTAADKTLDYTPATGILFGNSGVAGTTQTTILGETPTWRYDGGDASAAGWNKATYGDDLTFVSAGADPTYNNGSNWSVPLADDSIKLNAGDLFTRPGDNTYSDLSNDDFWYKGLIRFPATMATEVLWSKYADGNNYIIADYVTGPDRVVFATNIGGGTKTLITPVTAGAWAAIDVVWDSSGSARLYVDGSPAHTLSVSSQGALDVNAVFTVGALSDATLKANGSIVYMALWQAASGWLSSHDQDTLVAAHYAALSSTAANWDGDLDDFAFYANARSAEWVRRAYNNGNDYGRPGVACLRAPEQEHSAAINFKEFDADVSGNMTFKLNNYQNPVDPADYPLAKTFAPGRWESSTAKWSWLKRTAESQKIIDANVSTLTVRPTLDTWDASGEGHIGGETFSYTGITEDVSGIGSEKVDRFDGVTKGLYPCVGADATWGRTYRWPRADGGAGGMGDNFPVSTVPYSWIGRRIALYVTAWDSASRKWHTEGDAELLWVGTITEDMVYDGAEGTWQLNAEHISALMDAEIGQDYLAESRLYGINLTGPAGLRLLVTEYSGLTIQAEADITLTAGWYLSHELLAFEIAKELNDATNWTGLNGNSHDTGGFSCTINPGKSEYQLHYAGTDDRNWFFDTNQEIATGLGPKYAFHPFIILGFASTPGAKTTQSSGPPQYKNTGFWMFDQSSDGLSSIYAQSKPYAAYQPLNTMVNGLRLYAYEAEKRFQDDQGGYVATRAYLRVGDMYFAINAIKPASDSNEMVLDAVQPPREGNEVAIGQLQGETAVRIRQLGVFEYPYGGDPTVFAASAIGPLKALLHPLLSTGTAGYNNATYDDAPLGWTVAMQDDLVDITGIEAMDAKLISAWPDLAQRKFVAIPKPISFRELLRSETKLFQLALVWDRGKFRIKDLMSPDIDAVAVTLGAGTAAKANEMPRVITSTRHVINQTVTKLYDHIKEDFQPPITINDMTSIQGLGGFVNTMKLDHYGIALDSLSESPQELLRKKFAQMENLLRFPWQEVTVSLSGDQILKLAVGDVVTYSSNNHPDPYGGGTMTTTVLGIVINLKWSYSRWVGTATLLLYSRYDGSQFKPWAGCAVIDQTHDAGNFTAGYNTTDQQLFLLDQEYGTGSDSDDGARFSDGDKVLIHERYPTDPTSPATGPYAATIDGDYESAGASLLAFDEADPMNGYDTDMEYVIISAIHGNATATQTAGNSFQATTSTALLSSSTKADRWG